MKIISFLTFFWLLNIQAASGQGESFVQERKAIRENTQRINSKKDWTATKTVEVWESTEGGQAMYFYDGETLEKIVVQHYGCTGKGVTEYYLLNDKLSFVYEVNTQYEHPIGVVSNPKILKKIETRSYFQNGDLIHQFHVTPLSDDYLAEEQKRLEAEFQHYVRLLAGQR